MPANVCDASDATQKAAAPMASPVDMSAGDHVKPEPVDISVGNEVKCEPPPDSAPADDSMQQVAEELSALSIKELKARCSAAGLSTEDCLNKSDLVQRAAEAHAKSSAGAPPTAIANASTWWEGLSTKELKKALERSGVNITACYERSDFEALAERHPCAGSQAKGSSGEVPTTSADGSGDYWVNFSAKQLRTLLSERNIATAGLLDRDDYLRAANANRAVLTAAVAVGTPRNGSGGAGSGQQLANGGKTSALDARQAKLELEKQRKIKEGLEALGGVVRGGYQIDIFGVKRGRCFQNPKCYRYLPGNVKMNGCAMQGMGAVQCQRCGFTNSDHDDLGRWSEGEPMLLDEHGHGWKFENAPDGGIRRVKV